MQRLLVGGREVLVFPQAVPLEACTHLDALLPWSDRSKRTVILEDSSLVQTIQAVLQPHLPLVLDYDPYLTLSDGHVTAWHLDRPLPGHATHKLLCYLNTVPNGGTVFSPTKPPAAPLVEVENHQGTVVLFDLRLWHRSQRVLPTHRKRSVSLRVRLVRELGFEPR